MLNLSLMPLDTDHIDEICEDIKKQQEQGVSNCAMMMMYLSPCGTPAIDRAEIYCERYDKFIEKFEKENICHGAMIQSTIGHVSPPEKPNPFTKVCGLKDGVTYEGTCCPMDTDFREYLKKQMSIVAKRNPSYIMIDDDVALMYRGYKGCACKKHMAEFNKLAGTNWDREELKKHIFSTDKEDDKYREIYIETQRRGMVGAVKKMREGIDSVNPKIQGIISTAANYCEFTEDIAEAFGGENLKRIVRINNGNYTAPGARWISKHMLRAATQKAIMGDKIDFFLAETDTCPQNRYSTSASGLHAHFTGTILEGAKGAKHWLTRLHTYEPKSGEAYRKVLAKYNKFYEKLADLSDELRPFGCRIPLSQTKDYGFNKEDVVNTFLSGWASCVLERMGLPLYFSKDEGGAVFIDDDTPEKFKDSELKEFFKGTVILTAEATDKLNKRGFSSLTGVDIREYKGATVSGEKIDDNGTVSSMAKIKEIVIKNKNVKPLSWNVNGEYKKTNLFPGVTEFANELGGKTYVFCGTALTKFSYLEAFSLLNESRKKQLVEILRNSDNLPIYYVGDEETYVRAGYLNDNSIMFALFNIGLDDIEEITLSCEKKPLKIEMLTPDGKRKECKFYEKDSVIHIEERADILYPVILFIK